MIIAAVLVLPEAAAAEDFAARPIRMIVAFAPGGTTDFVARLVAERASGTLGRSIVVRTSRGERPIADEMIAKAEPDASTVFFSTMGALAINPSLRPDLPYSPTRDFAPVAMLARNTTVLAVSPALGVHSVGELVTRAKQKPGAIGMAVTGIGANSHLALELFQSAADVKFQIIPYRGAAQAMTDMLGGRVDGIFADAPVLLAKLHAGKLVALGILSETRSMCSPVCRPSWSSGFLTRLRRTGRAWAPAATPTVIARLNRAFVDAVNDTDVRRQLRENGVTVSATSPEAFGRLIASETERWGKIIREKGLKPAT